MLISQDPNSHWKKLLSFRNSSRRIVGALWLQDNQVTHRFFFELNEISTFRCFYMVTILN